MSPRSIRPALLAGVLLSLVLAATAAATPVVQATAGSGGAGTSADLHGMAYSRTAASPTTGPVTYHFEYGTTTAYGTSSQGGTGNGDISETVPGLTAGTTYHFRLVATDADGTVQSNDATFTTAEAGPADTDGDHDSDESDQCPTQPGTYFGCPDPDGDHVVGAVDKCPTQAGRPQANGCPDADWDGYPDAQDKCPNEPPSGGPTLTDGCNDSDKDGVSRAADKCPTTYGPDRPDGCPLPFFQATFMWAKPAHMKYLSNPSLAIGCTYDMKARGCFFHVTMRLTAASARELGVKDPTIFEVRGRATKRIRYSGGGFDRIAEENIDIAPAMARALHKARRVTIELSGTYHWANEPDKQLKTKAGKPVLRFTLTNKSGKNYGTGLFGKKPTPQPGRPEEG